MKTFFKIISLIIFGIGFLGILAHSAHSLTLPLEEERVYVSNKTNNSLTLSWVSHDTCAVEVHYGLDEHNLVNTAYDQRGSVIVASTHYVRLLNLEPGAEYYYEIRENGLVKHQGQEILFPAIGVPPGIGSGRVYGQAQYSDASWAEGAIIYIKIEDRDSTGTLGESSLLSALVDISEGWWGPINLSIARGEDGTSYFSYSLTGKDVLHITGHAYQRQGEGQEYTNFTDGSLIAGELILSEAGTRIDFPAGHTIWRCPSEKSSYTSYNFLNDLGDDAASQRAYDSDLTLLHTGYLFFGKPCGDDFPIAQGKIYSVCTKKDVWLNW